MPTRVQADRAVHHPVWGGHALRDTPSPASQRLAQSTARRRMAGQVLAEHGTQHIEGEPAEQLVSSHLAKPRQCTAASTKASRFIGKAKASSMAVYSVASSA